MGCARHSGAPVRIRLRASFFTALVATVFLIVACCVIELRALGGPDPTKGRRLDLYPSDALLTEPYGEDPNRWLVILHCVGIGYMLLGLNTVCDVYFTGALEVMVEEWNIKPDVAGATFMAAGGSAPEFFTSLIGTTWVISDVGFSTIVGSAVFNVLFVIGLCGFVAQGDIELTWWPLFRDCTYYIIGLSLLACFAADQKIGLAEAVILFLAYLIYCLIMYYNPGIEALVDSKVRKAKKQVLPSEAEPSSGRKVQPVQETESGASTTDAGASSNAVTQSSPSTLTKLDDESNDCHTNSQNVETATISSTNHRGSGLTLDTGIGTVASMDTGADASVVATTGKPSDLSSIGDSSCSQASPSMHPSLRDAALTPQDTAAVALQAASASSMDCSPGRHGIAEANGPPEESAEQEGDSDDEDDGCFMDWPSGRGNQIIWLLSLPMYVPLYFLVPWPRKERHMFVVTFSVSLLWIAGFAFLLVWWVHTLGQVLHIKDVIMNFTLLAMGTSIPDAASSVAVARKGEGDMAVSSSIGSNVFDILVGLPVPWIIKILIEGGNFDYKVTIFSEFLTFYVILLLAMVFSVILSIHFLGWKLNKTLGAAMALLYLIFLAIAIYVETETPAALKM